ncbi:MAG: DUF1963 domain-containing protein [Ruminococcaceae bacterium]|nr:DUF1963 domain-containing protein [Oscillospiraceae bacterium]
MNAKKTKALIIGLFAALGLFAIVMMAIEIGANKEKTANTLFRGGILLATCVIGILKMIGKKSGIRITPEWVSDHFEKELRGAFEGEERKNERGRLLFAAACYAKDENKKAEVHLSRLLPLCQATEDFRSVLLFLALCNADMGYSKLAIGYYRELLRYDPTCSTAWSNLGLLYRKEGKHTDALACYANALESDPENAYAHNNMATAYFSLGEYELALSYAKTALSIKADLFQASNAACLACHLLGRAEEGQKYFRISVTNGADGSELAQTIQNLGGVSAEPARENGIPAPLRDALTDFIRKTSRPFLRACLPAMGTNSKLGGIPVAEVPVDSDGNPMQLLALIDCEELMGLPCFPKKGFLQFFIADTPLYGADFDHPTVQKNFRVTYHNSSVEQLQGISQPAPSPQFPIKGRFYLQYALSVAPMNDEDYRFEAQMNQCLKAHGLPDFDQLEGDQQEYLRGAVHSEGHRLGGYPHFTQEDPRRNAEYQRYDTLLLQIDTHDLQNDVKIMIGDEGVMNFFIPSENLRRLDFSDILYWWDCH